MKDKRAGFSLPFSLLGAALLLAAAQPALAQPPPVVRLNAGIHVIQAEVVAEGEARARGLMHRKSLAQNAGMLFIFDDPGIHCMWMKNTLIALSVAFIDDQGKIVNIEDMEPHSLESHCAARPVKYALEMNRGWFTAKGVAPGSRLGGIPGTR